MEKEENLPSNIAIFPLSNAIFFPGTILPLNIFENRYLQLVGDCMKEKRMFGMVQPKNRLTQNPEVYKVGCLGKIVSFNETRDKRYIISLSGIIRFKIINEEKNSNKLYRNFKVDYSDFIHDLESNNKKNFNLEKNIFLKKIKFFFDKIEYPVQIEELAKLNFDQLIDTICMISPFSNEEKQKLIEARRIEDKLKILDEIINFSIFDSYQNKTIQ